MILLSVFPSVRLSGFVCPTRLFHLVGGLHLQTLRFPTRGYNSSTLGHRRPSVLSRCWSGYGAVLPLQHRGRFTHYHLSEARYVELCSSTNLLIWSHKDTSNVALFIIVNDNVNDDQWKLPNSCHSHSLIVVMSPF